MTSTRAVRVGLRGFSYLWLANSHLHPYTAPLPFNPDIEDAALNVNLVFRWEFLLGSTLYLVYTHSQSPNLTLMPGEIGNLSFGALGRAPSADIVLLKLAYWIG